MEGWLIKQTASANADGESETTAASRRPRERSASTGMRSNNGNGQNNRRASAGGANNGSVSRQSSAGAANIGKAASRRASATAPSNGKARHAFQSIQGGNSLPQAARANGNRSNNTQRQCGGLPRSRSNTSQATIEMALARPAIPNALSAGVLFDSLSLRLENVDAAYEEQAMHSNSNRSLGELCHALTDSYPSRLESCRNILTSLTASILSKHEELQKEEVVAVFQTLLSVFTGKCTTLLDIVQSHPEIASFQIDCWCLAFRMFEKKCNSKLGQEDGILYKLFGKHVSLANHILLQVIDALYSQILWEEYGATPTFGTRVFDHLRALCVRIGAVVPLLPTSCSLLTKISSQRWHASLTNEQNNNELAKKYYVSAIDPLTHKRFISSGEASPKDQSRLKSYQHKIPRREIEAAWSIIGFVSCCTSRTFSARDFKEPRELLGRIVHYDCGTLPRGDNQFPPSKLQVDICAREIKWICVLLSSKLLGDLPSMESFIKQIIQRSVMLEAFDKVLNLLPSAPQTKVNKALKKLWGYSCITCSSAESESDLQAGLMNMDTFSVDDSTNNVFCVMPSTVLLQRCVSLVATYANMSMTKNPRWRCFRAILQSLSSEFDKRASELEAKPENRKAGSQINVDSFAEMFESIETATTTQIVESPTSSHFREAACYLMLAGVVARSRYDVPGTISLNKDFREKIWEKSSDKKMCCHQKHYFDRMSGDAPISSSNICLLYTSAKTMTFTTLLHLYVRDFKSEPLQITEQLRNHLLAVKMDDDIKMMEYLVTSIISTLLASCDIIDNLNQRGRVAEHEKTCKAHLDSSIFCADVIRSIAIWLTLIFGRAKFIVELIANAAPSDNKLVQLADAIKRLGGSRFFLFVMQSLTRALNVIVETAARNTFSKALSRDGCLEKAFRSCLGAIRKSISLVQPSLQSSNDWESAAKVYISFVKTTIFNKNDNGQLCRKQSGGALSVLAALCSVGQAQPALCDVYDIFKSKQNRNQDDSRFYLQQMGVCFSCELARLAQHSRSCKALATQHADKVFEHLLISLLDADTLAMFPTCNLSYLSHLDGHNSRSKGNNVLSKSQVYSPMALQDPNQEAYKIKRMSGDYFDTAGPTYTSKNIWSFCENVGHVLVQFDDTKHSLQMWPLIRTLGHDIIILCERLRSDKSLLELLPKVSVERECLKRLLVFQALLSALKRDKDHCFDAILQKEGCISQVISTSIIENLFYLSGIELELEEQRNIGCVDPETRYERAKALTFHRAYTELCGSLMTLLLREGIHWESSSMRDLVRHQLIVSAFMGKLDIRRTIEGAAMNFSFCLRNKSSKGSLNHLTPDLSQSFFRRSGELLLICDSSCRLDNYGTMLFNSMLHAASVIPLSETAVLDSFVKAVTYRFVLVPEAIGIYSPVASEGLQRAVDDRILCSEVLRNNDPHEQKLILGLREWAMDNFFVYLFKRRDSSTPLTIIPLRLLTCMLKTYSSEDIDSSQKIHDAGGSLASIFTYAKLFHSLKECLCISITSNTCEATFIVELFSCACHFLALPMPTGTVTNKSTENETLLSWACTSSKNSTGFDADSAHPAYIFEVLKWLNICGKLLRIQSSTAALCGFVTRVNSKKDGAERYTLDEDEYKNPEFLHLCSSFKLLANLETVLSFREVNNGQSFNPHAEKTSNIGYGDKILMSKESLRAIEEFSNCLACHSS